MGLLDNVRQNVYNEKCLLQFVLILHFLGDFMELWSKHHILLLVPSYILILIFAFLLNRILGKKSLKIRMIPFQVVTIILLVLEVFKQVISAIQGYDLYHIPLHFCSVFLYIMPLMSFYKGKYKAAIDNVTATSLVALLLFMIVYPALIFPGSCVNEFFTNFISFHTISFHILGVFAAVLLFALKLYEPSKKSYLKAVIIFAIGYVIIAGGMSQIIETNFSNFYHCNVGPIESVRLSMIESLGYTLPQTIYVVVLGILHILFLMGMYYLFLFIKKLTNKSTN